MLCRSVSIQKKSRNLPVPLNFKAGSKVVLNGQKMKKLHEGMEIKRTLNHPMIERIDEGLKQKKKENLKGKNHNSERSVC